MNRSILLLLLSLCAGVMTAQGGIHDEDSPDKFSLGLSLGTPSGVAVVAFVPLGPVQLRAGGGWWRATWNGLDGSIGIPVSSNSMLTQSVSAVWGYFKANPILPDNSGRTVESIRREHYLGVAYDVNYAGFFVRTGVARGWGDYPNPQILLQCGYLFSL